MSDHFSTIPTDTVVTGDCVAVLQDYPDNFFSVCITDPPYNYEFIGRAWDDEEINRRLHRVKQSRTLVKNIPYGSGLAGGVRNRRWYERVRANILEYQAWVKAWGNQVYRTLRPGAYVLVFNSTRTSAHVQVALEEVGFYARDTLVYRRHSGIPKGLNYSKKLEKSGDNNAAQWDGWHSALRNEWEAISVLQKPLVDNYMTTVQEWGVGLLHAEWDGTHFQSNMLDQFSRLKQGNIDGHCTVKPIELMRFLVGLTVPQNGQHIVLDPFAGTGTTCVAAKQLDRHFLGIDINEKYVEASRRRLEQTSLGLGL